MEGAVPKPITEGRERGTDSEFVSYLISMIESSYGMRTMGLQEAKRALALGEIKDPREKERLEKAVQ